MATNMLAIGAAALVGSAAKTYFGGETTQFKPNSSLEFKTFGPDQSLASSVTGAAMNFLDIDPYQGSSLQAKVNKYVPGWVTTGISNLASGSTGKPTKTETKKNDMFRDMRQLPDYDMVSPNRIRTDTDFSALPVGRNGLVQASLSNPDLLKFLAKRLETRVPKRILAQVQPVGSTTLGKVSVRRTATRTSPYTKGIDKD